MLSPVSMKMHFRSFLASAVLVTTMQTAANACILTSQIQPELKIRFIDNPNYAYVKGVIYDGASKLASLGDWVCSTGGTCRYYQGTVGEGVIIGMNNGKPTNGTGSIPSAYLFSGLSLGDKWNTRLRSASRGLWSRGKTCTERWYDFP